jgi:hypothetical protein
MTEDAEMKEILVKIYDAMLRDQGIRHFIEGYATNWEIELCSVAIVQNGFGQFERIFKHTAPRKEAAAIPAIITYEMAADVVKKYWDRRVK